jgi:hypothetical protein
MGKWVADQGFDELWQVGDFCTMDSLTRHAHPGSKTFADLPSFRDDLDSLLLALQAFKTGLADWSGPKTITLGNHEHRAAKFEDDNPQMAGHVMNAIVMAFESFGWRVIPFGEFAFTHGVGIVHHPINAMGKAYGGKTANQRAGSDSIFSILHGHDHKYEIAPSAKIGPMGHLDIISVGCALPHGLVEDYAAHGPSGWAWGVCDFRISEGQILDKNFTSMPTLEERYG